MPPPLECGDVVWAHQKGYPWWPAVLARCPKEEKGKVVKDPNMGEWKVEVGKKVKLHCIFLGWNMERAWLQENEYRKFVREDAGDGRKKEYRVKIKEFKESHLEAIQLAIDVLDDPTNPMNHLVKNNDCISSYPTGMDDDYGDQEEEEKGEDAQIDSKLIKKSRSRTRQSSVKPVNVDRKISKVETVCKILSNGSVAGQFKNISDKVKSSKAKKSVEKVSNDCNNNAGKIGKIKKFHQKRVGDDCGVGAGDGVCQCVGCLLDDCGQCRFCQDKICFGGEGILQRKCSRKTCVRDVIDRDFELVEKNNSKEVDAVNVKKNKERHANMNDETDSDADAEEANLVINLDNEATAVSVENVTATRYEEDELSHTYGELPSSSSISYKSTGMRDPTVWDQVNSTMKEAEQSLIINSVSSSKLIKPPPTTGHLAATSPSGSDNSALTISTPEQSPSVADHVLSPCDTNDEGVYFNADIINVIIEENIVESTCADQPEDKREDIPIEAMQDGTNSCVENSGAKIESDKATAKATKLAEIIDDFQVQDKNDSRSQSSKDGAMEEDIKITAVDVLRSASAGKSSDSKTMLDLERCEYKKSSHKPKKSEDRCEDGKPHKSSKSKSKDRSDHKKSSTSGKCDVVSRLAKSADAIKKIVKSTVSQEKLKRITEIDMFKPSLTGDKSKDDARCVMKDRRNQNVEKRVESTSKDSKCGHTITAKLPHKKVKHSIEDESQACDDERSGTGKTIKSKMKNLHSARHVDKIVDVKSSDDGALMLKKSKAKHKNKDHSTLKDVPPKGNDILGLKKKNQKVEGSASNPVISAPILTSFKIPKSKATPKSKASDSRFVDNETIEDVKEKRESSKRSRKELKDDIMKSVENGRDCNMDTKHGETVARNTVSKDRNSVPEFSSEVAENQKSKIWEPTNRKVGNSNQVENPIREAGSIKSRTNKRNWVDAVDWSEQATPDSTTNEDEEPEKNGRSMDHDKDSDEDTSWKRKRKIEIKDSDRCRKKVKTASDNCRMSNENYVGCSGQIESSSRKMMMPTYTMSREILETLGEKVLFDSHCHMDFILFWKSPGLKFETFDQFVQAYPLMEHSSLEGFITNFCCPNIWKDHLVSPSPLIHSLLSRPSVYYTIGCHPHFALDLLSSHKFLQMELLIEKADKNCVAIGECGLDTSRKNGAQMPEQIRVFKKQVRLAMRLKKPLVLHIRGAEREALQALEEVDLPVDWPIHRHCWNDTWDVCKEWLKRYTNSVVGLTPLVTFHNAEDLLHVVEMLPLEKLVLETDAPYFLPRGGGPDSLLGHTNRMFSLPPHVANVAAKVAVVKQCHVNEVLSASRENLRRVYRV